MLFLARQEKTAHGLDPHRNIGPAHESTEVPEGAGQKKRLNARRWNRDSLTWFIYWMQNIPGAHNRLTYRGRPLINWWTFIGDFDRAMARGMGLVA